MPDKSRPSAGSSRAKGTAAGAAAPDEGCAQRFSVKVEDGVVSLDLDELAAPAPELADTGATPCPAAA